MKQTSNEGQTGIESIRIAGMMMDELPMAAAAYAKQQLPEICETDDENKVRNIKAKYPIQTVDWIDGAIGDCEATIKNVQQLSRDQSTMINEYVGHISLCEYRDKALKQLDITLDADKIKELKLQFPPYNVKAMHQQIVQCNEAINRANDVIDKEHRSISELRELRAKCIDRDTKLKAFGK